LDRKFCWGGSLVFGFFVLPKFSKTPHKKQQTRCKWIWVTHTYFLTITYISR